MDETNKKYQKLDSLKVYDIEGDYKTILKAKKKNIAQLIDKGGSMYLYLGLLDAIDLHLIPFVVDGKYGFINKMAEVVIEPIYDEIKGTFFNIDSYVAVKKEKYWSAIDSNGKELLPFIYSKIFPSPDSSLVACSHSGWTVIDLKTGCTIVKAGTYKLIERFRYGFARVKNDDKWGIINSQGKLVLNNEYESLYPWDEWYEATTKVKKNKDDKEVVLSLTNL